MDEILIQDEAQDNLKEDYLNCAKCGDITPDCEASDTEDGLVCEKCFNDLYTQCDECSNHILTEDTFVVDGDTYCTDCYDNLEYCERCEERGRNVETSTVNARGGEQQWCDCCRDENSFWCERCEENYSDYYSSTHVRRYGTLCDSCCEHIGTFVCCECNDVWCVEDISNEEDDSDDWICNNCITNGRRFIHGYSYKPFPNFKVANNQARKSDTLYFGLELEVERDNSNVDVGKMAEKIVNEDVYYMKNDGSLNHGFEIVTHPMSFEFIQETKATIFKPLLDKLIEAGYRSYDSKTCGIHIHLTKKCFSTWQLYRFIKFFLDNRDFVTAISQRKIEQLDRWATIEEESNDSIIYKAKKKSGNHRRYSAVNLQNDKTIEIRIFRGTLNYLSFLKNIEFCYALFNFSRDIKETTVDAFKEYIEQSNEYAMLKKFIKTKNL
jgi:hypothetical protein